MRKHTRDRAPSFTAYRPPRALALAVASAAPFAIAAVFSGVRDTVPPATVALVLVLVVVIIAVVSGERLVAIVAAVSAAAGFDFFHTLPYGSFTIRSRDDVQAAILLLVVAALVGEVTAWGRRHRDAAVEATTDLARINSVSALIAEGSSPDTVIAIVSDHLVEVLSLQDCHYDPYPPSRPIAVLNQHGRVLHVQTEWPADKMGLPGPQMTMPVMWNGAEVGRFVLTPTPGRPVPLRRRQAAVTLAALVAPLISLRSS